MNKKQIFILIISLLFILPIGLNAQNQKVKLPSKSISVKTAFDQIEKQTGLSVDYDSKIIDIKKIISTPSQTLVLKDLMTLLLKDTKCSYIINKSHVIISYSADETKNSQNETASGTKKYAGTVIDKTGEPVIGVNVILKGKNIGTITDINGKFSINASEKSILQITYIGYQTQEIVLTDKTNLQVKLIEDQKLLDELVVVGYGIQKKSSLTAAVTTVNTDEIVKVTKPNIYSALQGRIAGLTITETSGDPSASPTLLLRGKGTIDGSTAPLILVDGVPTETLNQLSSYDVESISVLKDAAAAAIYGARAANGVILVTTKQGSSEAKKPVIQFNSYVGMQTLAQFPTTMNALQFAEMTNEIAKNDGRGAYAVFSSEDIEQYKNGIYDDYHANTNWRKQVIKDVAPIYNNHISVSGNNKLGHYYVSGEYMKQTGMIKEIDENNRMNLRANITSQITDKFQFRYNTNYIRTFRKSGGLASIFSSVLTTPPIVPVKYSDGHWGNMAIANNAFLRNTSNVVQNVEEYGSREMYWNTMNNSAEFTYTPIKDLVLKAMGTYNNSWADRYQYDKSWVSWNPLTQTVSQTGAGLLTENWSKEYKYDFQATATYDKSINNHSFKFLAGFSSESFRSDWIQGYRKNFINDNIYELSAGDASTQTNSGGADQWAFASLFGRINYSFADKYLFEANMRYDGSSRFVTGKQWGLFPSFSFGWNMNKESFLENYSFIDLLKLRMSCGQLGNAEKVGLYLWFDGIDSGSYYNFDGTLITGTRPSDPANKDLSWETTTTYNVGLDGSFLKGKFNFEMDLWKKNTDGILLTVPISTMVGANNSNYTVNAGKVSSHGFDLSLGTKGKFSKDFTYGVRLSVTGWNSWIVDLGNRASAFGTEFRPGEELGNYYGYECLGIINDKATLDTYKKIENVAPQTDLGDLQYKDQNGDGRLDYMDVVKIGNYNTKNSFGLNAEFAYKNFDMQVFFQGATNVDKKIDGSTRSTGTYNSSDLNKLDRWTEENMNADALYPRLRREYTFNTASESSFWIKDASYIKLKNLQIGYNLPKSLLSKIQILNLRFYLSGTNLFTFAPNYLDGYDPEVDMKTDIYPTLRVFSFGLNLQF